MLSTFEVPDDVNPHVFLGTRYLSLSTCFRRNKDIYQDLYLFHDRRTEASQVPQTALR